MSILVFLLVFTDLPIFRYFTKKLPGFIYYDVKQEQVISFRKELKRWSRSLLRSFLIKQGAPTTINRTLEIAEIRAELLVNMTKLAKKKEQNSTNNNGTKIDKEKNGKEKEKKKKNGGGFYFHKLKRLWISARELAEGYDSLR